jgi:septin family protein
MIHCCLYFIAPHRLKHIDLAFMRRLHKYVNIVPIIAKSDTMTTKEKEEFKLQVREALISSGVELFPFDLDVVRAMEQQDKQEYKPPWAVVGSTDAYLEAGLTVYQRKYPWGNALSSEPAHSDLPALRNLVMWSGQWQELKLSTRAKYEVWRAERGLLADASTSIGRGCHAAAGRLAVAGRAVADGYRCACRVLRLPPRVTLATLLLLLLAAAGAAAASAAQTKWAAERSASHKLELLREQVRPRSAGNPARAPAPEPGFEPKP